MREADRHRHQLGGLVAGEAEHHAGVSGTTHVHSLGDVGRLLVDADQHTAGLRVEPILGSRVADLTDRLPDDARDVHVAVGRDLSGDQDQPGRDRRLACHPGQRVLAEDGVQDGVGDLVGELVRMALGHRFRGEATGKTLLVASHGEVLL